MTLEKKEVYWYSSIVETFEIVSLDIIMSEVNYYLFSMFEFNKSLFPD